MDIRKRIEAFWGGEKPDKIPYTVLGYLWEAQKDAPEWEGLFKKGLGVTKFLTNYAPKWANTESKITSYDDNGKKIKRTTYITPVG